MKKRFAIWLGSLATFGLVAFLATNYFQPGVEGPTKGANSDPLARSDTVSYDNRDESHSPLEFAQKHADKVLEEIVLQLHIDSSPKAVAEYFGPGSKEPLTSFENYRKQRAGELKFAEALERLLDGERPEVAYESIGFQEAGADTAQWDFYVNSSSAFKQNLAKTLRKSAEMSFDEFVAELVPGLTPIYLQRSISQKICERPTINRKVLEELRNVYPEGAFVSPPSEGEIRYQCSKHVHKWVIDFARDFIGPVEKRLEGWEKHLPFLPPYFG